MKSQHNRVIVLLVSILLLCAAVITAGCRSDHALRPDAKLPSSKGKFWFYAESTEDSTKWKLHFENDTAKPIAFFSHPFQYEYLLQTPFGKVRKVRGTMNDPRADYPSLSIRELVIMKPSTTYECLIRLPEGERVDLPAGTRCGVVLLSHGQFEKSLIALLQERGVELLRENVFSAGAIE